MAETAKVLNPKKTVLIPSLKAGCSLASSITGADVRKLKTMFPEVPVVAYINTDADTKSEVDVCCASGNASKVVKWALKSWKTNKVIFLPDKFLAQNVARDMDADIFFPNMSANSKTITQEFALRTKHFAPKTPLFIGWEGKCEVHEKFTPQDVDGLRHNRMIAIK